MISATDTFVTHQSVDESELGGPVRRRQRGAMAVGEMVIYLIVFIVFSALATWAGSYLIARGDASMATSNAQALLSSAPQFRGVGGYGNGSLLPSLDIAGAIPSTMTYDKETDQLTNNWNGMVQLQGKDAGYALLYTNVPQDACITMAQNVNLDKKIDLMVNQTGSGSGAKGGSMTRSEATSKCNKDYNTLLWRTNVSSFNNQGLPR
ncbi:type 4 pilus major pilin [Salinicola endophyticus]|uniref:Type 4 pilus major pilin n=1 Tax=Salinicola endophyticus TaxID=1949083 RepID=A0AB74UF76_9GAMM